MITKYLKTSGGDWNNLTDMMTWIGTQISSPGLSDHVDILVEQGQTFGSDPATEYTATASGGLAYMNSKNITIRTDPVGWPTLLNLATLLGKFVISYGSVYLPGFVDFRQLRLGTEGNTLFRSNGSSVGCRVLRCFHCAKNLGQPISSGVAGSGYYNSSLFAVGISDFSFYDCNMRNCMIGYYKATPVTMAGPSVNFTRYCNFWNWGGGGFNYGLITHVNKTELDPKLVDQICQSASDSVATMLARSAALTGKSTALIDLAEPVNTPNFSDMGVVDIIGNPMSLPPATTTTTTTTMSSTSSSSSSSTLSSTSSSSSSSSTLSSTSSTLSSTSSTSSTLSSTSSTTTI